MIKRRRWPFFFAVYTVLLVGGWLLGQWLPQIPELSITPRNEPVVHQMIMTTLVIFILTSALPFVPGAEIGFGLIMLFGGRIALLVYVGMFVALFLAFLVGRYIPMSLLAGFFKWLGFTRAHDLMLKLIPLNAEQRIALLVEHAPPRVVPFMLRHRYLTLMLALNVPGNSLIGGGGGIALIAGLSGVFSYQGFLSAVAVAIAPVPIFFFLTL